ncbi:MAG: DUF3786 domain-containing protein [Deltaproteobacteria bacterium]|nr:MAG: DUF3786 domain-containing protein [Deltaproteobacteria bacterium]
MSASDSSKDTRGIYQDPAEIDPNLWSELSSLEVNDVCVRASVRYEKDRGCYRIPFLHKTYGCFPERRLIECLDHGDHHKPTFEFYLVLLTYLLRAQPIGLSGRTVTGSEIRGGDFFFRGPHVLFTRPLEKRFGRDAQTFLEAGLLLGGGQTDFGDVSFRLWPLPKIPLGYILWLEDEEFPPRLVITFDASVEEHLPLDVIWALVNRVGKALLRST